MTGQPSFRAADNKVLSAQTKTGSSSPEIDRSIKYPASCRQVASQSPKRSRSDARHRSESTGRRLTEESRHEISSAKQSSTREWIPHDPRLSVTPLPPDAQQCSPHQCRAVLQPPRHRRRVRQVPLSRTTSATGATCMAVEGSSQNCAGSDFSGNQACATALLRFLRPSEFRRERRRRRLS